MPGLRDALTSVGRASYDHRGRHDQPVFGDLETLHAEIEDAVPAGFLAKHSKGVGNLPVGLWAAVLDPDVTTTPTKGIYVVYLFDVPRERVSLSLNQGVTAATEQAAVLGLTSTTLLKREGSAVRERLTHVEDLEASIDLRGGGIVRKYEHGNIVARTWDLNSLPDEATLVAELTRFVGLYADAVAAKEDLLLDGGTETVTYARDPSIRTRGREPVFAPKDSSSYLATVAAAVQKKSRSHEAVVAKLGRWAMARGFVADTGVHPRDLVLTRNGSEYLVEVKAFPVGKPRKAVRECIGQLFEYRAFLSSPEVRLVAGLCASPGGAYTELLSALDVAAVWPAPGQAWQGNALAVSEGLVDLLASD